MKQVLPIIIVAAVSISSCQEAFGPDVELLPEFSHNGVGPPIPTDGQVAYYAFTNGSAQDASGNGYPGIADDPTPTQDRFGAAAGALNFDGQQDSIKIGSLGGIDFDQNGGTIALWFRVEGVQPLFANHLIGFRDASNTQNFRLSFQPEGEVFVNIGVGSSMQPAVTYPLDTWLHVTATFDQTMLRLYMNGDEVGSVATTDGLQATDGFIGRYAHFSTKSFNGDIDEVRVYNRALDDKEVQKLYHGSRNPHGPPGNSGCVAPPAGCGNSPHND